MTRRSSDLSKIREARENLLTRLECELKPADDERSIEQSLDAEDTVDRYLAAVNDGSLELPDRQDLAFALVLLLVTSRSLEQRDLDLLGRLNATEIGLSLFEIAGQVEEMKVRAITAFEQFAGSSEEQLKDRFPASPIDDDAVPF